MIFLNRPLYKAEVRYGAAIIISFICMFAAQVMKCDGRIAALENPAIQEYQYQ